ncbi:MAG: hypothetical protein Q4D51_04605 [Eubacteriales bacterium]|nr:hypothetical protein [Eubacteriales bacterium]
MRKYRMIVALSMMVCLMTGCSGQAKKYDTNTLVVKGNGSLEEVAIEDFSEIAVQAEELENYIDAQIDQYNDENGKQIKRTYMNTKDMNNVKLAIKYKNIDSFNGFNLLECQYADFAEIEESAIRGTYTSVDGEQVKHTDFVNVEKAKVLVLPEATNVVVKGDILYYNDQVTYADGVATTSGEENAVIIFK